MKKYLFTAIFMLIATFAPAQESSIYENKTVVTVDSAKASTLYTRALEALSDWAGSQQRSKANVDVQDKDEGLVVYKGQLYLGFGKANIAYGWETYANFTLKVRCKDGRAQITVTVPSASYYWTANSTVATIPISDVWPKYKYKGDYRIKTASTILIPKMPDAVTDLINQIATRIKAEEEDF